LLQQSLNQGSERVELPSVEEINENVARLEDMKTRLVDIASRSIVPSFRHPGFIKREDDTRMQDVIQSPTKFPYGEGYHQSNTGGGHPRYQESVSSTEAYWGSEVGRSKYKKRSVRVRLSM